MDPRINVNSIVQVTNKDNGWFPCLVVVTEVKGWGIQGYTSIPFKGQAFIRLKWEDIEYIGEAIYVLLNEPVTQSIQRFGSDITDLAKE